MSHVSDIVAAVFLSVGVCLFAVTAVGLVVARRLLDQIHYLAPGTLIGSVAIVAAVLVHEGLSQSGVKSILIVLLLLGANPVLSHATARAGRIRRKHKLTPRSDEQFPAGKEIG